MAIRPRTSAAQQVAQQAPAVAPPPPPPPMAQAESLNFGDLGFYTAGFTIAPGRYVITDFTVRMFKGEKSSVAERLGVMVTFVPLSDPKPERSQTQFYSLGSQADKTYMPASNGKGIVHIPGAPAAGAPNSTNWFIFLKSMYDGGLPPGVFANDLSVLEGIWVETALEDEPAERATFQSNTAEVQTSGPRTPRKIAVVHQVLDGGKPWENTGGWPEAPVIFPDQQAGAPVNGAPAVPVAAPVIRRPVAPPSGLGQLGQLAPTTAPPAVPPPAFPADNSSIIVHAINSVGDAIEQQMKVNPAMTAISRLIVRNGTYAAAQAKLGDATALMVIQMFDAPGGLENILAQIGYKLNGQMVVPA